jgi:ABC-2 type transport system ATP-binding protein
MGARVDVEGVSVRYGGLTAVDDLSFSLAADKIYGLLGRNGSGKTSLLSVVGAHRRASAGTVRIDGEPVFENGRVTGRVCLVRHTGDAVSRTDRLKHALLQAATLREGWDPERAVELMDLFELPLDAKFGELSLGKRSAFGVVLGLASRAPLTMFDEAHLGMDAPSRYKFYDALLADFAAAPRTVVVSTHLIEELAAVLEEIVIIDSGRLVLHEEVDALRSRGTSVTGEADAVDRFVSGLTVLARKELGRTKEVSVFGELDAARRDRARAEGLDLSPIALQDLFVHLTEPVGGAR